jgi:hypothetical protein
METQDSTTTRLDHYIKYRLPWAPGHQRQALRDFVQAIIDQQTGHVADLHFTPMCAMLLTASEGERHGTHFRTVSSLSQ